MQDGYTLEQIEIMNKQMQKNQETNNMYTPEQIVKMQNDAAREEISGAKSEEHTGLSPGSKFDSDKVPLDLLDMEAILGLGRVLAFGKAKYAAHNWRGGISYTRLIAALLRHTFAFLSGEDLDKESGLPHVDHIGCCWMFLSNMTKKRKDMDDRWRSTLVGDTHEASTFHKL